SGSGTSSTCVTPTMVAICPAIAPQRSFTSHEKLIASRVIGPLQFPTVNVNGCVATNGPAFGLFWRIDMRQICSDTFLPFHAFHRSSDGVHSCSVVTRRHT